MGGFLTMYTLTKDPMYKDKAQEVGDILLPAFSTDTGIPRSIVDIQTGVSIAILTVLKFVIASPVYQIYFPSRAARITLGLEATAFYRK